MKDVTENDVTVKDVTEKDVTVKDVTVKDVTVKDIWSDFDLEDKNLSEDDEFQTLEVDLEGKDILEEEEVRRSSSDSEGSIVSEEEVQTSDRDSSNSDTEVTLRIMATKQEIEDLLRKQDHFKVSSFQPLVYNGQSSESAQEFLSQFDNYVKIAGIDDAEKTLVFELLLRGLAKHWYRTLSNDDKKDIATIKSKFRETYMSKSKNWLTTQKLEARKLGPTEKAEKYIQEVLEMGSIIGLTVNEQRAALIRGLTPRLKAQLVTHNPQTLTDTIERIYLSETALTMTPDSVNVVDSITNCQLANISATVQKLEERMSEIVKPQQPVNMWPNVTNPVPTGTPTHYPRVPPPVSLQNGSYPYHRQQPQRPQLRSYSTPPMRDERSIQCYTCGRFGHIARNCYQRNPAGRMTYPNTVNRGPRQQHYQGSEYAPRSSKNFFSRQQM